jgi:hypothetical protein
VFNPLYHAAVAGVEYYNSAERGDAREAGKQAFKAVSNVASLALMFTGGGAAGTAGRAGGASTIAIPVLAEAPGVGIVVTTTEVVVPRAAAATAQAVRAGGPAAAAGILMMAGNGDKPPPPSPKSSGGPAPKSHGGSPSTGPKGQASARNTPSAPAPAAAAEQAAQSASGALRFGANDLVYGPSAKGALRQLQQSAGGRLLTDVGGPGAGQSWAQFSIQTLEKQLAAGGRIRFDLSHVDDLAGALKGTGPHAGTVTAQELRFLQANWGRFSGNTSFYRGGAEVAAPW